MAADAHQTLSETIYQELRQKILSGEWPTLMRINELALSRELHVSRTPIRWALERLRDEDLLEYSPRTGFRVKRLTVEDVREIYQLREMLEGMVYPAAALRMSESDYEQLHDNIEASREAVERGDFQALMTLSGEFNHTMLIIAKRPRAAMLIQQLNEYLLNFRRYSFTDSMERRAEAVEEHGQILEAMHHKELILLGELIQRHMRHAREHVVHSLQEWEKSSRSEPDDSKAGESELGEPAVGARDQA